MKNVVNILNNYLNLFAARTGLVHTYLHTLCVDTFIPEGDVTLGDDLTADSTSGGVIALGTTGPILLYIELFSKSLFAELTPESRRSTSS